MLAISLTTEDRHCDQNACESATVMEPQVCAKCFWTDNGILIEWKQPRYKCKKYSYIL